MKRRQFLQAAGSSLLLPLLPGAMSTANAAPATLSQRCLVFIGLYGGPDLRHLLPPVITASTDTQSLAYQFWQARAKSFNIAASAQNLEGYVNYFQANYTTVNLPGTSTPAPFGISNTSGWLINMWNAGNVAIFSNVIGSTSRDHSIGQMVLDMGDRSAGLNDFSKPGWGGRLAELLGGNARVGALTNSPRQFCYGPLANDPNSHQNARVLNLRDSRNMMLQSFSASNSTQLAQANYGNNVLARALKSYYDGASMVASSPYQTFAAHQSNLRTFGNALSSRLGNEITGSIPVPPALRALYAAPASGQSDLRLNSTYFGVQMRNVYDAVAANDILNLRVMSLEYLGWDSHQFQSTILQANLTDVFGTNRALDSLYQNLSPADRDNMIFVLGGEFGRQLAANGGAGTDHGDGNNMFVIGSKVNGGMYGNMFPQSEIQPINLFARGNNDDIAGLTGIESIFGAVADWVAGSSTGNMVLLNRNNTPIESGVDLSSLFLV